MSNLSSLWLSKEKLETLLKGVNAKNEKGIELTISTSNEVNDYGQNVSAYVSQSKEDPNTPSFSHLFDLLSKKRYCNVAHKKW